MIEIERKFLLKNLPELASNISSMMRIVQYYDADTPWRYRKEQWYEDKKYFKQMKEYQGNGKSLESDMIRISQDEFTEGLIRNTPHFITKVRYDYVVPDPKVKMTIDKFLNIHLLLLEIEVPEIDYPVVLPPLLREQIIDEVTGNPNFSNKNLVP